MVLLLALSTTFITYCVLLLNEEHLLALLTTVFFLVCASNVYSVIVDSAAERQAETMRQIVKGELIRRLLIEEIDREFIRLEAAFAELELTIQTLYLEIPNTMLEIYQAELQHQFQLIMIEFLDELVLKHSLILETSKTTVVDAVCDELSE